MAGYTREQRAAKAAELAKTPTATVNVPTLDEIPQVVRKAGVIRSRVDLREETERILANRKEFSGLENKLGYDGDNPGWKRRWVNEENVPGRVQEGFRFVLRDEVNMSDSLRYGNEDTGDRVSKHAGRDEYGNPYKTYLMEIPQQIADMLDDEKSHAKIRNSEISIRSGSVGTPQGNNRTGAKSGLPEIKLS